MDIWKSIKPSRVTPESFVVLIEIPQGSKIKCVFDESTQSLLVDRILHTSTHYPANYGLIPRTKAEDGDSINALVMCSEVLHPLSLVECYPVGMVSMTDSGTTDEKIIAVPYGDPKFNGYRDISELPEHIVKELSHFFLVYKTLEGMVTANIEFGNSVVAKNSLLRSILRYKETVDTGLSLTPS